MTRTLLATLLLASLAACQQSTPRSRPSAASAASCRTEVDRVYAAQNRVDLSRRDQRDTPFAASYNSGITSQGLSSRFARDNMLDSCLASSASDAAPAARDTGTGPTMSPAAR